MASTQGGDLLAANLAVGGTLIKADTSSWGDLLHTIPMRIEKLTASRLTLRYDNGSDAELVVMVKDGKVTDRIYGRSDRHYDRANLYQEDDLDLALLKERRRAHNLQSEAKRAVSTWQSNTSDRVKARAAIIALEDWLTAAAALDAKDAL